MMWQNNDIQKFILGETILYREFQCTKKDIFIF